MDKVIWMQFQALMVVLCPASRLTESCGNSGLRWTLERNVFLDFEIIFIKENSTSHRQTQRWLNGRFKPNLLQPNQKCYQYIYYSLLQ